jgi:hypothetical protein
MKKVRWIPIWAIVGLSVGFGSTFPALRYYGETEILPIRRRGDCFTGNDCPTIKHAKRLEEYMSGSATGAAEIPAKIEATSKILEKCIV